MFKEPDFYRSVLCSSFLFKYVLKVVADQWRILPEMQAFKLQIDAQSHTTSNSCEKVY